jgi:hypothetical protein
MNKLPDGSAFFIAEVGSPRPDPIAWNPYNKVVCDHRDGTILRATTDIERKKRGLPTPWTPEIGYTECLMTPIW